LLVLAALSLIIVLQNTQAVETRLLLVTITMPRAILLFVTLVIGFVLGMVAAGWLGHRRKRAAERQQAPGGR